MKHSAMRHAALLLQLLLLLLEGVRGALFEPSQQQGVTAEAWGAS